MAQKSYRFTVSIPGEFIPLLEQRMKEEHIGTKSKFMLLLLTFDLMTRCPHTITAQVVNEPEAMFYRVVDEIVREFAGARTKVSGWISKRVAEMLKNGADLEPRKD